MCRFSRTLGWHDHSSLAFPVSKWSRDLIQDCGGVVKVSLGACPWNMAPRRKRPGDQTRNRSRPTRSQRRRDDDPADAATGMEVTVSSDSEEAHPTAGTRSARPLTAFSGSTGSPPPSVTAAIEEALDQIG